MNAVSRASLSVLVAALTTSGAAPSTFGQTARSRFATSDSRSDYVHRIKLYDSDYLVIQPTSKVPYSSRQTCGRCHDMTQSTRGFHFAVNERIQDHGRPGEPWIWVDPFTGTQLPLSYRPWGNSLRPEALEISRWDFTLKFGSRTCGGRPGRVPTARPASSDEAADESEDEREPAVDRFRLSGALEADCMACHARDSTFDMEAWNHQIENQNFAWASTAALGLAKVEGAVRLLPDDFDPAAAPTGSRRRAAPPTLVYDANRFDADGAVFFDVVRSPSNNACYRCHSTISVGSIASPRWTHDGDVHLVAGLRCADCHPNGPGHETVRGFEGEIHPQQNYVANLTCRGCHLGPASEGSAAALGGGRLGAPYPEHRGLPPIHLERLSCTACHAGPWPGRTAGLVQTARSHALGLQAHRKVHQQPEIVEPVFMPDLNGVLYPHRVVWPSYWATRKGDELTPVNPQEAQRVLRRVLRVRTDFYEEMTTVRLSRAQLAEALGEERAATPRAEWTESERRKIEDIERAEGPRAFREKLTGGLVQLKKSLDGEEPVYVAGEKIYQLDAKGELEIADNPRPAPYAWPIGHDVRPARWSLGAGGCTDCHAEGSPLADVRVTTEAPVPDGDVSVRPMRDYAKLDAALWTVWNRSFEARAAFKWALVASVVCLSGVVLVGGTAWLAARLADRQDRR
jgi:hypothetical protein